MKKNKKTFHKAPGCESANKRLLEEKCCMKEEHEIGNTKKN